MAAHRSKYVSMFKVNGVPILPPLMTAEKRRQMLIYKEMAIQIQHFSKRQKKFPTEPVSLEISYDLFRHGHSYIPQPQTARKEFSDASTLAAVSKCERLNKLGRTDTLVYDNRANSIILTLEGFEEETDFQSVEIEKPQHLDQNENKISPNVPKSPAKEETVCTPSRRQPYAAFIPIPSICVNPPTPCVANNPICETASLPKRLCSPTLKSDNETALIRSNSFTLEGPSSVLLEHIKNQKLKKSTATQDTVESKAKRVKKVETKPKAKPPCSSSLSHCSNNTTSFKSKRSPYEMKQSSKTKLGRKHKFVKPVTPKKLPQNTIDSSTTNVDFTPKSTSKLDLLKDVEEQHRARFLDLVRQQQIEQKRLQDQFDTQQKLLLEQLTAKMAKVQMQSPPSTSTIESTHSSPTPSSEHDIFSSRLTPRRRLFPEKLSSPGTTIVKDLTPSPQSSSSRRLGRKKRLDWAATKINAYARGYLTRRLFRTDYVQRIVQTVKDTLIFVLNLHLETSQDNSEGSIKLKARLLQQLTSASRTLHSVFIDTTIKERMEIIARDRKYIQTKLLYMKRSPRILL